MCVSDRWNILNNPAALDTGRRRCVSDRWNILLFNPAALSTAVLRAAGLNIFHLSYTHLRPVVSRAAGINIFPLSDTHLPLL
jgi:hypothetical protein